MDRVELALRLFFCLPFAHSEDIADQDLSVRLNAALGSRGWATPKGLVRQTNRRRFRAARRACLRAATYALRARHSPNAMKRLRL
jgi:Bacterial protein of unknown function (DUF924)